MKQTFFTLIAVLILQTIGYVQTNVSGGIYTNTTWTKANSPYIVTDTVVVFPGVTLTIEPGVEVRFEDDKRLEIRQGKLTAIGTVNDSIIFTSNSVTPSAGIWDKIWINGGTLLSQFEFCHVKYANVGIYNHHLFQNQNTMAELDIKNSKFSYNIKAISCTGSGGGYSTIENSTITSNIDGFSGAQVIFNNCTLN
jgi:hypothetical protein